MNKNKNLRLWIWGWWASQLILVYSSVDSFFHSWTRFYKDRMNYFHFNHLILFLKKKNIFQKSSIHNHETWLDTCLLYIYIYIYSHPQTDCFIVSQLFSVAMHVGCLKLGSKPTWLYVRLSITLLSQQVNHVSSGIIRH